MRRCLALVFAVLIKEISCSRDDFLNPLLLAKRSVFEHLESPSSPSDDEKAFTETFFTQRLDHGNILDERTWQQRYYVPSNATYVSGSPIFLILGGEWEISPVHIEKGYLIELIDNFAAYPIYLEHRFYGKSIPLDLSVESLGYLSMDQALEDTAFFTQSVKNSMGLDGKWIVIGASYTGDMAAWARARYPHLYFAAYASGAPVNAQVDIPEYYEVMNEAFALADPNCPPILTAAMDELKTLVDTNQAAKITELFNLVEEIDLSVEDDVTLLYFTITQFFGSLVQSAKSNSTAVVCSILTEGQATPLDTVATMMRPLSENVPLRMDASLLVERYRNQMEANADITRQWLYQACTEFGWFTSVSSPDQPFGPVVPIDFRLRFCSAVYGPEFTRERLEAGVARTNLLHGSRDPQISRVIYTVGTLDPVSPAQMLQDVHPESPVELIDGESHCTDITEPTRPGNTAALVAARQRVIDYLTLWINM